MLLHTCEQAIATLTCLRTKCLLLLLLLLHWVESLLLCLHGSKLLLALHGIEAGLLLHAAVAEARLLLLLLLLLLHHVHLLHLLDLMALLGRLEVETVQGLVLAGCWCLGWELIIEV